MNITSSLLLTVGFISPAGVAAQSGIIMVLSSSGNGKATSHLLFGNNALIAEAIYEGGQPEAMPAAGVAGLLPGRRGAGRGAQVMRRIAAPAFLMGYSCVLFLDL